MKIKKENTQNVFILWIVVIMTTLGFPLLLDFSMVLNELLSNLICLSCVWAKIIISTLSVFLSCCRCSPPNFFILFYSSLQFVFCFLLLLLLLFVTILVSLLTCVCMGVRCCYEDYQFIWRKCVTITTVFNVRI